MAGARQASFRDSGNERIDWFAVEGLGRALVGFTRLPVPHESQRTQQRRAASPSPRQPQNDAVLRGRRRHSPGAGQPPSPGRGSGEHHHEPHVSFNAIRPSRERSTWHASRLSHDSPGRTPCAYTSGTCSGIPTRVVSDSEYPAVGGSTPWARRSSPSCSASPCRNRRCQPCPRRRQRGSRPPRPARGAAASRRGSEGAATGRRGGLPAGDEPADRPARRVAGVRVVTRRW